MNDNNDMEHLGATGPDNGRYQYGTGAGPSNYMTHPLEIGAPQDQRDLRDRGYNDATAPSYSYSNGADLSYTTSASQSVAPLNPPRSYWYDTDEEEEPFDRDAIDPALRLRTTRTAHSVIAESIRSEDVRTRRRRSRIFATLKRRGRKARAASGTASDTSGPGGLRSIASDDGGSESAPPPSESFQSSRVDTTVTVEPVVEGDKGKKPMPRRAVYVNLPLPTNMVDKNGEPTMRYARNKVKTSKYTLVTFLPRNLFEQFYRVANIYFLFLVILQLFTIFGATTPEIAMLPLVAILGMTAIKDAVEDWRRAQIDEEVNTSAATKLGNWKNVNQPTDPRSWLERLFHIGLNPQKPSKGVRKLREAEAKAGKQIVMERAKESQDLERLASHADQSLQPPGQAFPLKEMPSSESLDALNLPFRPRAVSPSSSAQSTMSSGVIDYSQGAPGTAQWERTLWKKLEVGDLVLLRDNEQVPADIVVLATSDRDSLCFVETKNLDGETNLKVRKAMPATSGIKSEEDLEHSHFFLDSEPPHANLYAYNGVLKYRSMANEGKHDDLKVEPVTINELLLRGCTLRNTKWVIGLVVFTGADTKIMLNGGETPSKRSKIERETNFNVIMNFIILMGLCIASALLHGYYRSMDNTSATYYEIGAEAAQNIYLDSLIVFVSCLIVFQNIVPISLYITIEIVKTIQAYFIHQDVEMYYAPYDTPCVPKTWNISDDLGQIEYVFSDKTGTLTQNIMEFKKCSIQGTAFGEGITEAMLGAAKREGKDTSTTMEDQAVELIEFKETMVDTMKDAFNNRYLREEQLTFIAPDLAQKLADKNDPMHPHIVAFFRALAICHSVLSDKPEPEDKPYVLDYKAESPDEAALVGAARDVGFPFVTRNTHKIDIEVLGQPERWTPLRVLEFNSTRKRMSVIVRSPEGKIILYCKGADSVIYERLAADHDEELKKSTLKDLETFANGGLRTLCIAYREMSEAEFADWSKRYDAASSATENRDEQIDKVAAEVEHNLLILGATALEDKLQEGVPDAIAMLHRAGIKLWILTGDKLQTAIEIGYSCNLLTNEMEVMIISADSAEGARAQIEAGLNKIASVCGPPPTKGASRIQHADMNANTEFAVVIDGESLRYALQPDLKPLFLSLGTQCAAVICCRVSPSQKAQTVKLVKEGCNALTLAIGDGANDVAMIQEANIGVGLFGLEGSQAAMSADYAFGQFRFLTRLLLVHGRWSYVRVADLHANFFYKNVIWTVAMFWFLIFNSFDGTYLFQYTFVLLYNLIFTSLPVGILGAFDQDTNAVASMAFPQLYKRGIQGLDYTRTRFWLYMADGLYQSAIIFFIPYLVYGDGASWSHTGLDTNNLYDLSSTMAAAGVMSANLYVGLNTRYWTIIPWLVTPISTLLVFVWIVIWSFLADLSYYGVVMVIYPTVNFWATIVLTCFLALGPRWLSMAFRQSYMYRDKDIIREAWVGGDLKDKLGIEHRKKRRRHRDVEAAEPPLSLYGFPDPPSRAPSRVQQNSMDGSPVRPMANESQQRPLLDKGSAPYTESSLAGSPQSQLAFPVPALYEPPSQDGPSRPTSGTSSPALHNLLIDTNNSSRRGSVGSRGSASPTMSRRGSLLNSPVRSTGPSPLGLGIGGVSIPSSRGGMGPLGADSSPYAQGPTPFPEASPSPRMGTGRAFADPSAVNSVNSNYSNASYASYGTGMAYDGSEAGDRERYRYTGSSDMFGLGPGRQTSSSPSPGLGTPGTPGRYQPSPLAASPATAYSPINSPVHRTTPSPAPLQDFGADTNNAWNNTTDTQHLNTTNSAPQRPVRPGSEYTGYAL